MMKIITIRGNNIEFENSDGEIEIIPLKDIGILITDRGPFMGLFRASYLLEQLRDYNYPKISNRITIGKKMSKYKKVNLDDYKIDANLK
jgi:hypothetical protein